MSDDNKDKVDYKDSLLLPKTDLPMRANLPEREPGFLDVWKKNELFSKLRESSASKEKFILHDGPP
jgi:isoleucyl-tRNA synthetase